MDSGGGSDSRDAGPAPASVYRCPKGHSDISIGTPVGDFDPNAGEVPVGSPKIPFCQDCERSFDIEDLVVS